MKPYWIIASLSAGTILACGPTKVPEPDRTEGAVECVAAPKAGSCPDKEGAEASVDAPPGYKLVSIDEGPISKDDKCCYGITIVASDADDKGAD